MRRRALVWCRHEANVCIAGFVVPRATPPAEPTTHHTPGHCELGPLPSSLIFMKLREARSRVYWRRFWPPKYSFWSIPQEIYQVLHTFVALQSHNWAKTLFKKIVFLKYWKWLQCLQSIIFCPFRPSWTVIQKTEQHLELKATLQSWADAPQLSTLTRN